MYCTQFSIPPEIFQQQKFPELWYAYTCTHNGDMKIKINMHVHACYLITSSDFSNSYALLEH